MHISRSVGRKSAIERFGWCSRLEKKKSLSFLEEGLYIGPQVSLVSGELFVCFAYTLLYEMK